MSSFEFDLHSPAIKALGSHFKLTEVILCDDGFSRDDQQVSPFPKHIRFKYDDDDDDDDDSAGKISSNTSLSALEDSIVTEDPELIQQMSVLGLPLSFQTSKQWSGQVKGKNKAKQHKNQHNLKRSEDQVQGWGRVSEDCHADTETKSSSSSSLSLPDQTELSYSGSDVSDGMVRLSNFHEWDKPADMAAEPASGLSEKLAVQAISDALEEHIHDRIYGNTSSKALTGDLEPDLQMEAEIMSIAATSHSCPEYTCSESYILNNRLGRNQEEMDIDLTKLVNTESSELNNSAMKTEELSSSNMWVLTNDDNFNTGCIFTSGDWSAFWDSFYMRYYFYNANTKESTWYPPPCMEKFASGNICCLSGEFNSDAQRVNVDPAVSTCGEEQLGVCKSGSNEQIGVGLCSQELSANDFPSDSVLFLDETSITKAVDLHVHDGHCQDESPLGSSFDAIAHSNNMKKETEEVDSVDGLQLENIAPANLRGLCESQLENNTGNCEGNSLADVANLSHASNLICASKAACDDDNIDCTLVEEREDIAKDSGMLEKCATTKRKKTRRNRRRKKSSNDNKDHEFKSIEEVYVDLTKYWCQRYLLFSRFDCGVKMDEEGWFSVTPEVIAKHQASRAGCGIVIDCFAGVGGNAIQFAKTSKHVIAIDIDPTKIDYANHNATIYGVEDRIDFIRGDCFSVAPNLKADTVFLSPPWGGPHYVKLESYDISMLQPHDGQFLFNTFKTIASMIIMFLPRNVNVVQLAELALSANPPWSLEVEKNFLNDKLKAVTAYFSKPSVQTG